MGQFTNYWGALMPRRVDEWLEENHDKPIPERVKRRIIRAANNLCGYCGLRVPVGGGEVDHIIALVNGGEHRESNLRYVHKHCHKNKTAEDVKEKATSDRKFSHVYGIAKPKRTFGYVKKPKSKPGHWEPYDFDDLGVPKRSRWVAQTTE
jgi:5-methylcytosine-specific restriction protein A